MLVSGGAAACKAAVLVSMQVSLVSWLGGEPLASQASKSAARRDKSGEWSKSGTSVISGQMLCARYRARGTGVPRS